MASGRDIEDTEPHRIAELFLVFIVISLLFGRLMKFLEHHLHGPARRGLRHTVHHIEEELLALGVISLLLIIAEDYLLKICVHNDDYNSKKKKKNGDSYPADDHRKLLAGEDSECSERDEPFWSAQTMHQTHYFIFMIAIVHVLYATTSFLLCLWRIQRWKRFEDNPELGSKTLENSPMMFGRNAFEYWFWSFWAQFSPSVDAALYVSMRSLFIERMELPEGFDFHLFLLNTMVDDFGIVVHAHWMMWVVAAIWILLPILLLVTTALSVFIVLLVGTKLELVGVMLSQQAYLSRSYQGEGSIKTQPISAPHTLLKRSLEVIGNKLGRSSEPQREEHQGPQLGTQSMSLFAHKPSSEIRLGVVRRAHSFEQNERPSIDFATVSHHQGGVRFGVQSDPKEDEISPVAEDTTQVSESMEAQAGNLLKSTFGKSKFPDSATFFWFGRPRLILRALQFVYFETAMAIALVFFDLWQDSDFILEDTALFGNDYLLVVILIVVGILCLLQTSFLMLPTYVLTSVAGSHCPEKVLAQAKKLNIKEAEVSKIEYLRNKSVLSRLDTLDKKPAQHHDQQMDHTHGHGSSASTEVLVGAMYKGKVERLQKQESRRFLVPSSSHGATQNSSVHTVVDVDEEDEEFQAIIEAFGSFESFLASIRASQELIREKCPAAVFNFDCYAGSYQGHQSTNFDVAAINLTLDLNAAAQSLKDQQTK